MKKLITLFAVLALAAPAAFANSITVVGPGQGLGGTDYSLEVVADSGSDRAYVETSAPAEETVFRTQFRIRIDSSLNLDVGKVLDISVLFGTNVPARNAKFSIQKLANGNYRLWAFAANNDTGKLFPYVVFNVAVDVDTLVDFEWQEATAADNDGIVRLIKNGGATSERTDVPSNGQNIDRVRFGAPVGTVATGAAGGTYRIDEVTMFRTLGSS